MALLSSSLNIAKAQALSFQKLTTADGLSNNYVIRTCIDKNGFLWIGTSEGLNRFDGKYTRQFNSFNTPLMKNSNIREVWCDADNRIWLRTSTSTLQVDPSGVFREVVTVYEKPDYGIRNIVFTKSKGIVLIGVYYLYHKKADGTFQRFSFPGDSLFYGRDFTDIAFVTDDVIAYSFTNEIIAVDFKKEKVIMRVAFPGVRNIARVNNDELLVIKERSNELTRISISQNKISGKFSGLTDQYGNNMNQNLFYTEGLYDGRVGITSPGAGLYIFEPATGKLINYRHDPANPLSLSNNEKTYLTVDTSGYLFVSSGSGLEYAKFSNKEEAIHSPFVYQVQIKDSVLDITGKSTIHFRNSGKPFTFYFSPGSFKYRNLKLEYKLEGEDDNWITAKDGFVKYNTLPPGSYSFKLRLQQPDKAWLYASRDFTFRITQLWWKTWWFRLAVFLFMAAAVWILLKSRENIIRRRSEAKLKEQQIISENLRQKLEIEKVISFFASSIGSKNTPGEIAGDVAKNCISQLSFEDCVIYLLDDTTQELVQKAAWGPKTTGDNKLVNPLRIPVGKGIVGAVAMSGKAEIINDTSADSRYIVDDQRRNSEICVPLMVDGKVIGVIDSEHSEKNFYNDHHLQVLKTVSALCANKIVMAQAEEARRKAQLDLAELNQKMAESRFMNLRLQMNPHFLFNSLSAIQHLIVSQKPTEAYKYLTVFSNLLRSVLTHADKNFISLDEEIKILKMYLDIESLRFKGSFYYSIKTEEGLDQEEIQLPSLLLQPFAENAIWHGLLSKEGEKKLEIFFGNKDDTHLRCLITDNGIGRKKAGEIKESQAASFVYEGKALQIIKDRLALLEQKTGKKAEVHITDLYEDSGKTKAAGTAVEVVLPYYFNKGL
jgi:putative methionine-R-sulfoxide reductase with GAF domain